MKKYIRPEIKVRVLESENLLAGSFQAKENNWEQTWDETPTAIGEQKDILSKQSSVWDDEEE